MDRQRKFLILFYRFLYFLSNYFLWKFSYFQYHAIKEQRDEISEIPLTIQSTNMLANEWRLQIPLMRELFTAFERSPLTMVRVGNQMRLMSGNYFPRPSNFQAFHEAATQTKPETTRKCVSAQTTIQTQFDTRCQATQTAPSSTPAKPAVNCVETDDNAIWSDQEEFAVNDKN